MTKLALGIFLFTFATVACVGAHAGPNDAVIEWQGHSANNDFISVGLENHRKLAKNRFQVGDSHLYQLGEKSGLSDFKSAIQKALDQIKNDKHPRLTVSIHTHGLPKGISIKDGDETLAYGDLVSAIKDAVQEKLPQKNIEINFYMDSCHSASVIPHLQSAFDAEAVRKRIQFKAWLAASLDLTAESDEFSEFLTKSSTTQQEIMRILDPTHICPGRFSEPALMMTLGGHSRHRYWTNSGEEFPTLPAADIAKLVQRSNDPFILERSLFALKELLFTSPELEQRCLELLKNPLLGHAVKIELLEYLSAVRFSLPELSQTLKSVMEDKSDCNNDQSCWIRRHAMKTLGNGSGPWIANYLWKRYHDTKRFDYDRGYLLEGIALLKPFPKALVSSIKDAIGVELSGLEEQTDYTALTGLGAALGAGDPTSVPYLADLVQKHSGSAGSAAAFVGLAGLRSASLAGVPQGRDALLTLLENPKLDLLFRSKVAYALGEIAKANPNDEAAIRKRGLPKIRLLADEIRRGELPGKDEAEDNCNVAIQRLGQ